MSGRDYRKVPGYYDRLTKALAAFHYAAIDAGTSTGEVQKLAMHFGMGVAQGELPPSITSHAAFGPLCASLGTPATSAGVINYIRGVQ